MPKNEQPLYQTIASFVQAHQNSASATHCATFVAAVSVLENFSAALKLPVDRQVSASDPFKYALTTDVIQNWYQMCDPEAVTAWTNTTWGAAMESVLAHINQDRTDANNGDLVNDAPGLPTHTIWRELGNLIDDVRTATVAEAVMISDIIEDIMVNDQSGANDINLFGKEATKRDRLTAVAELALRQPPRSGAVPSTSEFVDGLAELQLAGRMDRVRDVLDENVTSAGGRWCLDDALDEARALETEQDDVEGI